MESQCVTFIHVATLANLRERHNDAGPKLRKCRTTHYAESTGVDFTRTPIQRQTTELGNQQEIVQDNCSLISGPISSLIKLKSETRQTGTYSGFEDFLLTCHCNSKIRQKTLTSKCRKHLMSFEILAWD